MSPSALETPASREIALHATGAVRLAELPPLALYVHVPWCVRKCPYCDFNSHEVRGEPPEGEYVDALVADLESSLPAVWGRRTRTVFIGGGTPSLLTPAAIDRLLTAVRTRLPVDPDAEVTMEANPGTFEAARFRGYRDAGVNRLSVGVQSFSDAKLAAIGRVHGADEARRALAAALGIFPTVNADLMYALPGQSPEEALADAREAVALGAPHVSAYHLTLEPGTRFHRDPPALPGEDAAADMQDAIEAALGEAGYEHYETSAFARPGHRARHNLNYWTFGDYLGLGAGAHGKISFPDRIVRASRIRSPRGYMSAALAGDAVDESHEVAPGELAFEFMLNALRLVEGFPAALFTQRTGLPITAVARELERAERDGLLERDPVVVRPSAKGRRFLNDLLERFLPAAAPPRSRAPSLRIYPADTSSRP
ncbi:MAG TPA: radical SAM family heme chaperone HemW [Usitatibacter sp.]|nr:radical SAM family heme chaperone HemW [Usitatibacter sp.]